MNSAEMRVQLYENLKRSGITDKMKVIYYSFTFKFLSVSLLLFILYFYIFFIDSFLLIIK